MEKVNTLKGTRKENKKKIMEMIEKGGSEEYETSWENGIPKSKKKSNIKKGANSRAKGARFELQVRKDLESEGRVIDKWNNNVELTPKGVPPSTEKKDLSDGGKLIIAKRKYNPFSKVMTIGTGFPDFISIKHVDGEMYSVIGVEVKMNGILSKIEKQKCAWYLKNKIFSQIWIARKGATPQAYPDKSSEKISTRGKRGRIEYDDFSEKYGGKFI